MNRFTLALAALCLPSGFAAAQDAGSFSPGYLTSSRPAHYLEPDLEAVRAATEKYKDVKVALAEGFIRDPMNHCHTAPMMGRPAEQGAMGIHYVRPDLLGITAGEPRVAGTGTYTDFTRPAILIYEPQADGSLVLVAVENLVFKKAWDAQHAERPSFHGVPYDFMEDDPATEADEAHQFEPHYDRHVWVYRENPNGVFAPFNPNVSCEHHEADGHSDTAHQHSAVTHGH